MNIMTTSTTPAFVTAPGMEITPHLHIMTDEKDRFATVIMSAEGADKKYQLFIDMSGEDAVAFDMSDMVNVTSIMNVVREYIEAPDFVDPDADNTRCMNTAIAEWVELTKPAEETPVEEPPVETPTEEKHHDGPPAGADHMIFFPLVNGEVYNTDINTFDWESNLPRMNDLVNKLNSFKGLIYNLFRADKDEKFHAEMLSNAKKVCEEAFNSLGIHPTYDDKLTIPNDTIKVLLQLQDIQTIYASIISYLNVYAVRKETDAQFRTLVASLNGVLNNLTGAKSNDPIDAIDAIADGGDA